MIVRKPLLYTTSLAAALLIGGCGNNSSNAYASQPTAVCVNQQGQRVSDAQCGGGYHGGGSNPFLWYYIGRNSTVPYYGERAMGGGYTRTPNATYYHAPSESNMSRATAMSTTSRGGFGSSAHSYGGSGGS